MKNLHESGPAIGRILQIQNCSFLNQLFDDVHVSDDGSKHQGAGSWTVRGVHIQSEPEWQFTLHFYSF